MSDTDLDSARMTKRRTLEFSSAEASRGMSLLRAAAAGRQLLEEDEGGGGEASRLLLLEVLDVELEQEEEEEEEEEAAAHGLKKVRPCFLSNGMAFSSLHFEVPRLPLLSIVPPR